MDQATDVALGSVSLLLEIGLMAGKLLRRDKNIVAQQIAFYACQKEFEEVYISQLIRLSKKNCVMAYRKQKFKVI